MNNMTPEEIINEYVKQYRKYVEKSVLSGNIEKKLRLLLRLVFESGCLYETKEFSKKLERIYQKLNA